MEITYDDVVKVRRQVENRIRNIIKWSIEGKVEPEKIFKQLQKTRNQWMDFEFELEHDCHGKG